jgi:hypothetical protein
MVQPPATVTAAGFDHYLAVHDLIAELLEFHRAPGDLLFHGFRTIEVTKSNLGLQGHARLLLTTSPYALPATTL